METQSGRETNPVSPRRASGPGKRGQAPGHEDCVRNALAPPGREPVPISLRRAPGATGSVSEPVSFSSRGTRVEDNPWHPKSPRPTQAAHPRRKTCPHGSGQKARCPVYQWQCHCSDDRSPGRCVSRGDFAGWAECHEAHQHRPGRELVGLVTLGPSYESTNPRGATRRVTRV